MMMGHPVVDEIALWSMPSMKASHDRVDEAVVAAWMGASENHHYCDDPSDDHGILDDPLVGRDNFDFDRWYDYCHRCYFDREDDGCCKFPVVFVSDAVLVLAVESHD